MRTEATRSIALATALSAVVLMPAFGAQTQTATPQTPSNGSPARTSPSAAIGQDYVLTIGDKLRVEVYREAQLSQSVEVRPDGKITLPLVGDVPAAGMTPRALGSALAERLREFLTNPVVTVIVAEANPPVIYVMGEVNAPGAVPLRAPITVLQALAMSGGFKDFANKKNIRILRRTANGVETIFFNYKEAVESRGRPLLLQPGDTVIVP
jgi:polysaccharide export outer membrane protein